MLQAAGPGDGDFHPSLPDIWSDDEMADYPLPGISKNQIVKIGKELKKDLIFDEDHFDDFASIFKAAYDWRNSHYLPMRAIRQESSRLMNSYKRPSFSAGRLKRMHSIRKKLKNTTNTLAQMQDLGGARIVVENMGDLALLLSAYDGGKSKHEIRLHRDYITQPKFGGYRSHHIVLKYQGIGKASQFNGRNIELQVRTEVQHAWSTAVEAVGLYLGQDLKGGIGDKKWLRFFDLMSSEMAVFEECPPREDLSNHRERRGEIEHLENELKAINTLRSLREGFAHIGSMRNLSKGSIMIQFDKDHNVTRVDSFSVPREGAEKYMSEEQNRININSVLIDLDKIENLQRAYPNYFLDVRAFTSHVWKVTKGYDPSFLINW